MEHDGTASATTLLGLDGMVLLAAEKNDGELWQLVETTATVVGCSGCGVRAAAHGRRKVAVRDLPSGGRPVVVVWAKRLWRCADPDCEVRTWSEAHPAIAPRAVLTERARRDACRRVGKEGHSVAAVRGSSVWAGPPSWPRCAITGSHSSMTRPGG